MRFVVGLCAAALLAWVGMRSFANPATVNDGWLWMLAAAVAGGYALSSTERLFPEPAARRWLAGGRRWRWAGVVILVVGVGLNIWANVILYQRLYDVPATAAWAVSLLLAVVGLALMQPRDPDRARAAPPDVDVGVTGEIHTAPGDAVRLPKSAQDGGHRVSWWEIGLLLGIVLLAIFLRLYRLHTIPPGIFIDETNAALDALNIHEGRPDSPFGTGWFETPTMYAYYLLGLFRIFGINWEALKAASLLPAILTVLALYPLGRTLLGVPGALAATFVLAVSRWHLTMSRWGWNEVAPPLFQVLGTYFLVRAAKNRRWLDFGLAGLLFGLGMYTYLASRLVVVAVVLYLVYRSVVERGFLRRSWPGLPLMALLYVMTFAPLAATYVRDPFTFVNRSQQVSILNDVRQAGSLQPLQENLTRHLEMFTVQGDLNPRHNLPGAPMLDPITGALFLIGMGYAVWRWRDHRRGLLLIWISVTLVGGILSSVNEGPQAYRTLAVVPAIALLVGDTVVRAWSVLAAGWRAAPASGHWWSGRPAMVAMLVPLALLALIATSNIAAYFGPQAEAEAVWQAFSPVETAVAREVAAKQLDHQLYLAPRLYHFSPLKFLTYRDPAVGGGGLRQTPYHLAQPVDGLPLTDLSGQDALFLLDLHYQDLVELFTTYYPGTSATVVTGPRAQPLYLSVTIPGEEIVALHGLQGSYPGITRRDAQIDFTWPADWPDGTGPGPVTWTGSLVVPASGQVELTGEGDLQITVDGQPWTEGRFLGKGPHALQVMQADPWVAGRAALRWRVAGQAAELVPAANLVAVSASQHGLRASYFANETWTGTPVFSQVVPLVLFAWDDQEPWFGPFSSSFTGYLEAPVDGTYVFSVNGDDGVRLLLDGQVVGEALQPDAANQFDITVPLTAGRHAIRVDHFQRGGGKALELWWQPPGSARQVVPPHVLTPD